MDILLEFRHSSGASVWIDMDDKTAYAYFRLHDSLGLVGRWSCRSHPRKCWIDWINTEV